MSKQLPIKRVCACGCRREFYIHKSQAWRYDRRAAFFRIDCENIPTGVQTIERTNYVIVFYEEVENDHK